MGEHAEVIYVKVNFQKPIAADKINRTKITIIMMEGGNGTAMLHMDEKTNNTELSTTKQKRLNNLLFKYSRLRVEAEREIRGILTKLGKHSVSIPKREADVTSKTFSFDSKKGSGCYVHGKDQVEIVAEVPTLRKKKFKREKDCEKTWTWKGFPINLISTGLVVQDQLKKRHTNRLLRGLTGSKNSSIPKRQADMTSTLLQLRVG
ncbi:hypothetical protein HUJ05_001130 [Dendroctonus ponderosae]|nr:hypothetical protein HUJ05_001130 [Dendroctonus ponderosae]